MDEVVSAVLGLGDTSYKYALHMQIFCSLRIFVDSKCYTGRLRRRWN